MDRRTLEEHPAAAAARTAPGAGRATLANLAKAARRPFAPDPVGFDARLAAAIIDGVWLVTVVVLLSPLLEKLKSPAGAGGPGLDGADVDGAMGLFLWLLYSTTEVLTAGTLGKRLLDVRVARRDGRPSSMRRRAVRWLVKGSPLLLLALPPAIRMASKYLPVPRGALMVPGTAGTVPADWPDRLVGGAYGAAALAAAVVAAGGLLVLLPGARALHDRVAGTAVYFDADVTAAAASPGPGFSPLMRAQPLRGRGRG